VSLFSKSRETVRLALGVACVQCCEFRDPQPGGEPGLVFGPLSIDEGDGKRPRPIRCNRRGPNFSKPCAAAECPIARELEPQVTDALFKGALERFGLPPAVADVVKAISKHATMPNAAAAVGQEHKP
jgi:hypothetical protein